MRKSDFTLPTLDDLFSTQAERDDAKLERVRNIPLAELHPFKGHPFKVQNNEEMQRMIESIRKVGAITPALARPLPDGGYELISGHRRLAACQVLGVETMPVIVRELSDDEAVIAMVDANLQRETILPSEKAFAYKMKLDAIKHQGIASVQVAEKLLSVEKVADDAGESKDQVRSTEWHPLPMFEATPKNCEAFRRWLDSQWAELPEALPTQTAAELVGHSPQRIYEWIREEALTGIKLGSIQYCAKAEFIGFMASPQRLAHPRTEKYKELIREFKYNRRRERENEQRRQKRKMMKEST